jgi:hypothetical protein
LLILGVYQGMLMVIRRGRGQDGKTLDRCERQLQKTVA